MLLELALWLERHYGAFRLFDEISGRSVCGLSATAGFGL